MLSVILRVLNKKGRIAISQAQSKVVAKQRQLTKLNTEKITIKYEVLWVVKKVRQTEQLKGLHL